MAQITKLFTHRHLRSDASSWVQQRRRGHPVRSGRGAAFWFLPMSASIVEVPMDDRELPFLFKGRSGDFQEVAVQGVITWRVADPAAVSDRIDFTIDLATGNWLKKPLEQVAALQVQLAQQMAVEWLAVRSVRDILTDSVEALRTTIIEGLANEGSLDAMGIEVVTIRVSSVRPTADLEKALQVPTFEAIQQQADEATFERRALAVEKERAIQENELQNRIELSRREASLIAQEGENARKRAKEASEAEQITTEGAVERHRLEAHAEAEAIALTESAKVDAEQARVSIYKDLAPSVMLGLAAQEFAGKLQSIEHLNLSPDALGPLLQSLLTAGTKKLQN